MFDPSNPNIFYSGGWDRQIITHDTRQANSVRSFLGPYVAGDSLDICGTTLLAGNYRSNDPIELYDLGTGEMIDYIQWQDEESQKGGMVMACQFGSPKNDTVIAGSSVLKELKMFSRKDGTPLSKVTGFGGPVVSLNLDHQGKTLAIGSVTGGAVLLQHGKDSE
jgi:WD40 repeat protein